MHLCFSVCVVVSLQARCVPVSDSADCVLCDGGSEESSLSEAAVCWSRREFDVRRTGQNSVPHDSASPLESSLCLFIF